MKQLITLSNKAANRIKEIMSKDHNSIGVRIGVKSGGCAGMSYIMEYAKENNPTDEIIEDKGVKVFVDPGAIMYLLGTEMDYKEEEFVDVVRNEFSGAHVILDIVGGPYIERNIKAASHDARIVQLAFAMGSKVEVNLMPIMLKRLIYTGLTEAFFTYVKVSFYAALFISFPIIASQLYMFVAPGLYRNERKAFMPFLIATPGSPFSSQWATIPGLKGS